MFDGLKDRLSSFRRDAEEEIDEAAADIEDEESVEESDAAAETADPVPESDADTVGDTEPDEAGDPAAEPETTDSPSAEPEASVEPETPVESDGSDELDTPTEPDTPVDESVGSEPDGSESTESETAVEPETAEPSIDETETVGTDEADDVGETEAEPEAADEREPTRLRRPSPSAADETEDEGDDSLGLGTRAKLFATGQSLIEAAELEEPLFELEMALLESDVEMSVTEAILDRLREELTGATRAQVKGTGLVVEEALAEALREVISVGQFDFEQRIVAADKPVTIVFTGVNGVGKTTTIAKLARYFEERGLSTVLANGDTYRAGANQQLGEHAENLDKEYITHEQGSDPAAVLYDAVEYAEAHDIDVVLGDTAGRLHTSNDLMAQLEKIDRVVDPDMTLFVDEAVAGQDATNRASEFDDAATIDGAILAKADADSQGGAAISIAHVTGKPILFLGTGQGYDDLARFDPDVLVDRLLGDEE
ncbi:signal recognition particle-docking protein FtsY [Halococcus thailandensis]|uniref:Signal recognition particle receptor FtsY n=1 Tax=Halococcus thailandensis JCM 13552 TaxID=1227457 RepID=M0N8F6_9EURY|nr:signal recognition particle-docking protein FtsY [Halococcus thailandensis]EMA52930.1 cell division protein FtsY [Halococcus thailandensis JCM 13552]